ncbi:MAG: hypothetical protein ACREJY_11560 [Candidatus Rokuibacteriota bacterium]
MEALAAGRAPGAQVAGHVETCVGCRAEIEGLSATWHLFEALPVLEPRAEVAVRLRRRLRWERARETLVSRERWQQAALAGVLGFVLSVLLGLAVPYQTMVALCNQLVSALLPTPAAYLVAGMVYGLVPMAAGAALLGRRGPRSGAVGLVEALLVFLVVLVPYLILRCSEFPPALLTGFIGGITLGALAGGAGGIWLRRHAVSI